MTDTLIVTGAIAILGAIFGTRRWPALAPHRRLLIVIGVILVAASAYLGRSDIVRGFRDGWAAVGTK